MIKHLLTKILKTDIIWNIFLEQIGFKLEIKNLKIAEKYSEINTILDNV